ncbi:MAG TPA: hypothetical protein VMT46_09280 [Anaerolineaceae bacterium]|nr:hypothetical protein [Anaerolineaceae bacterium]
MPTSETPVSLTLQLGMGPDEDPDTLDRLARQLLIELQDLDVESAGLVRGGPAPQGAKSADLVTLGSLAVVMLPAVVPKVIELLQSWTMRAENRTVKIKSQVADRSIELEYSPTALSPAQLNQLVTTINQALQPAAKSASSE